MYENNNTVSIDWKGLFIKLIVVAIIVFAIFKGYEYFSNKPVSTTTTPSTTTQLFNANLESLRQAGENYYDYSNYPAEGQTVMVTLSELVTKGNVKELYDANGNACNGENSYVSLTNDNGQYKLKATLSCGETSNYTVVMIGCECEGDECAQAIKKLESEKDNSSKKSSNSSANNSSKKSSSSSNKSSSTSNKNTNNSVNNVTTTKPKSTQVVDMSQKNTTTTTTTQVATTNTTTQYTVKFDSNGGDYVATQYVNKYGTAYEPEEPEKDDARFVGWYYNGRLFDFDTEITRNITLEAYYWETKTLKTQVYSAAWDTNGTNYVTVSHKLRIPNELSDNNIKNVRIKYLTNARTMSSSYDLQRYVNNHVATFDGYRYSNWDYYTTNASTLAYMSNIRVRKENGYTYDRWVNWSANAYTQCYTPFTVNGETNKCNYGIVYTVVWEYDELTD